MKRRAFGTYAIAKICQVAPITVGRWAEEGKLPFFTTGGGHRRVWEDDLVKFLKAHNYPIPTDLQISTRPLILIVDDEPQVRKLIRRTIEKKLPNTRLEEAVDGYEAGEKINSMAPALLILDILLPGLSGLKVCERIRANKSMKNLVIIAISGDQNESTKAKIMKAGANAFLEKPFSPQLLLQTIERFIEK